MPLCRSVFWGAVCFLFFSCQEQKEEPPNLPPYIVGHIPYDESKDNPDFELCNNGYIIENGGRRSPYKGGVKKMWTYFQPTFDQLAYKKGEDGYLTVRFLANCKGEKDRFRVLAINKRYRPKEFSEDITTLLLESVRNAPDWQIASHKGKNYDGYNMVTFKLTDGQVTDLIP
ncbi:MAG: hypothetical protein AAFZ15_20655 [Bacteroidota bacterium]